MTVVAKYFRRSDCNPQTSGDEGLHSGLRVADASIMPDVVRANTNVTTMIIAEHVSDFIKAGN